MVVGFALHRCFGRILIKNEFSCGRRHMFTSTRQTVKRRLRIIGEVQDTQVNDKPYHAGQLFVHKVFSYRAVILFSWKLKYYDHDLSEKIGRNVGEERLYYQALMDERDAANRNMMCMTPTPTYLGKEESSVVTLPDSDYMPHEDILPYTSLQDTNLPIQHKLFPECFSLNRKSQDLFAKWQLRNNRWLPLSEVHKQTSHDVRVTVITRYMGMMDQIYYWQYNVRIENLSTAPVQLRERQWKIFKKKTGMMAIERDRGVNNLEPVLTPENPAFQYGSHVSMTEARAYMYGTYTMERQDGSTFDVKIPPTDLEASRDTMKYSVEPNIDPFV